MLDQIQPFQNAANDYIQSEIPKLVEFQAQSRKFKCEKPTTVHDKTTSPSRGRLSTEEILRVTIERFTQHSTQNDDNYSLLMHPYGSSLSGLSFKDMRTMEILHNLFAVAEKIGSKEFEQARKWLKHCDWISSKNERVAFYFVKALREKIARETGKDNEASFEEKRRSEVINASLDLDLATLIFHENVPITQVPLFVGVQTMIETVASSTRIHVIDLANRCGSQWTVLVQALADRKDCLIRHLKITAIGETKEQKLEEVGKRLSSFAESVNLPFSFQGIYVSEMGEPKEEVYNIKADEAVIVHFPFILKSMISKPKCLKSLMKVLIKLNPCLIVVSEVDANLNSCSFVVCFAEALLYYSAFFDCIEASMKVESSARMELKTIYFGEGMRNIVANEGEERINRSIKLKVWRAFFARFGLKEIELSNSSINLANMLLSNFGNSFKKMKGEKCIEESSKNHRGNQRLSPVEVARVAGARFIHYSSQRNVGLFLHMHPFDHTLTSLSEEETRDVELLYILFTAVEKINDKEFGQAAKWLDRCDWISSKLVDPVQHVAFHFAEALREKLALETGKKSAKGLEEKRKS
ncbi:Transcription factor GRAS [Dillenia turbinata]|uniref:Transcription factor GRAS n=1 Tax=Dillenia turbinata TaxID=194707 RepID=A0AAN8Z845_9MAGN